MCNSWLKAIPSLTGRWAFCGTIHEVNKVMVKADAASPITPKAGARVRVLRKADSAVLWQGVSDIRGEYHPKHLPTTEEVVVVAEDLERGFSAVATGPLRPTEQPALSTPEYMRLYEGLPVQVPVVVSHVRGPHVVTVSGLPEGVEFDARTHSIFGVFAAGDYEVTVKLQSAAGTRTEKVSFTVAPLPKLQFSQSEVTPRDGQNPLLGHVDYHIDSVGNMGSAVFSAPEGLPDGLQLTATGHLHGTVTGAGEVLIRLEEGVRVFEGNVPILPPNWEIVVYCSTRVGGFTLGPITSHALHFVGGFDEYAD